MDEVPLYEFLNSKTCLLLKGQLLMHDSIKCIFTMIKSCEFFPVDGIDHRDVFVLHSYH